VCVCFCNTFTVFCLCTYLYCFVVILLFYVFCFVVIVVLFIFIFVCTSGGLLPPGESPIALSNNNNNNNNNIIIIYIYIYRSRDGVVGVATRYGLEGPGIESRWGRHIRTYADWL
jgi:hypothetical protein